jgi:hypothetical protein
MPRRHKGVWWYSSTIFDLSPRYTGEWSVSRAGRFTPGGNRHWIGGWVDPKTGLDAVGKGKNLHYRVSDKVECYRLRDCFRNTNQRFNHPYTLPPITLTDCMPITVSHRRFGGNVLHPSSVSTYDKQATRRLKMEIVLPPKRWLRSTKLHGFRSQKTVLFTTTTVTTSNPTSLVSLGSVRLPTIAQ